MLTMTSAAGDDRTFTPAVGADVTVTESESGTAERGRIVDDFGDGVLPAEQTGRTWAPARRWAIALDSGRLVFADTEDLGPARP